MFVFKKDNAVGNFSKSDNTTETPAEGYWNEYGFGNLESQSLRKLKSKNIASLKEILAWPKTDCVIRSLSMASKTMCAMEWPAVIPIARSQVDA